MFPLRQRDPAKPNLAKTMDAYERGYNAAIKVVVPEIRRQRAFGIGIGFSVGVATGVVLAVQVGGLL